MAVGLYSGRAMPATVGRIVAAGARIALLAVLVLAGAACSSDDDGDGATATTASTASTGQASVTTGSGVTSPSTKVPLGPPRTKETFTIPSDLLFEFDSAELSPEADQLLADALELATRLSKATIAVDGYTDSIGDAGYNQELSRRRAVSVSTWLEAHGVDPGRLTVRGFGAENPVGDNSTPEGQRMNRRVEIEVLSKA